MNLQTRHDPTSHLPRHSLILCKTEARKILHIPSKVNQFAVPAALRFKSFAVEERILVPLDQGSFCEDGFCLGALVIGSAKIEESAQLVKDTANRHSIPKQSLERGL